MTAPTREVFDRWQDDFVTRWVFAALEQGAKDCEAQWWRDSWAVGGANPANDVKTMSLLRELKARADATRALGECSYEDFCATLGDEPNE